MGNDQPGASAFAGYLWDNRDDNLVTRLPGAGDWLAGFLWGEKDKLSTQPQGALGEHSFAGYLWHTRMDSNPAQGSQTPAPTRRYLVQGRSIAAVTAAVEASGGIITHRLNLIKAVGAELTESQRAKLVQDGAVIAVQLDQAIQTAGKDSYVYPTYSVKGAPELFLEGNTVSWEIANLGSKSLEISNIALAWPKANGELVRITLNGKTLQDSGLPASGASLSGNWGKKGERKILRAHRLTLEFSGSIDPSQGNYAFSVSFKQELSVEFEYLGGAAASAG